MWLTATKMDLKLLNISPYYAWKKAASQEHWISTVVTAMLKKSMPRAAKRRESMTLLPCAIQMMKQTYSHADTFLCTLTKSEVKEGRLKRMKNP